MKTALIAFCLLFLTITSLPCGAQNPTPGKASRQAAQYERYAKPVEWPEYSRHMFNDSETGMTFTLKTSWIPGTDHKGMFRYIMDAFPRKTTTTAEAVKSSGLDSPKKTEDFIKHVKFCTINLVLQDTDGFLLRKIPVEFSYKVSDDAHISSLAANDFVQMDLDEYKRFVGDAPTSNSWSITWACY